MWNSLSQQNDLSFTIRLTETLTLHRLVSQTTRAQQRDRGRESVSRPQSARPREERLQVGLGFPDIVFSADFAFPSRNTRGGLSCVIDMRVLSGACAQGFGVCCTFTG